MARIRTNIRFRCPICVSYTFVNFCDRRICQGPNAFWKRRSYLLVKCQKRTHSIIGYQLRPYQEKNLPPNTASIHHACLVYPVKYDAKLEPNVLEVEVLSHL